MDLKNIKVEIKKEEEDENKWEDKVIKMEVLHHSDVPAKSSQVSQDLPVDLRTNGKLCSQSLLQQMTYSHPQTFINDLKKHQTIDPFYLMKSEQIYGKEMKENKNNSGVKLETHLPSVWKDLSKRKRKRGDCPEADNLSIKRQKLNIENSFAAKNNEVHSNKELANTLKNNMERYLPLQYAQRCIPSNDKDYTDLLERLKSSQSSNLSTTFVKETESLLAAVHHSQMLYYSYCSKLLQNLQTRQYIEEQERTYKLISKSSQKEAESLPSSALVNKADKIHKPLSKSRFNTSKKTLKTLTKYRCSSENKNEDSMSMHVPYHSPKSDENRDSLSKNKIQLRGLQQDKSETESAQDDSQTSWEKEEHKDLNSRKRVSRALTGKHVRHGTGASLSTLRTLREKLQEKQRIRRAHSVNSDGEGRTLHN